jgi:alpha-L-rhamnosidase
MNSKSILTYLIILIIFCLNFNLFSQSKITEYFSAPSSLLDCKKATAQWIWDSGEENPRNYYLLVRKNIVLDKLPDSATAYVSAYAFADVYINDFYIDRCPMNCDPVYQVYEKRDLVKYFHKGKNTIAALVYNFGFGMHHRINARGGFFFQGKFTFEDHSVLSINSDDSWLVKKADAWDNKTSFRSPNEHLIGFVERFDAAKMPDNWMSSGFDDSGWNKAKMIGIPPVNPWNNIVVVNRPVLFRENVNPVGKWYVKDLVVYDFGKEVSGWPVFELFSENNGTSLIIGTAERLTADSLAMCNYRMNYTDTLICKKGFQKWSPVSWRGFRYLSISRKDNTIIKNIYAINRHYDLQQEGQFECSDPLLNEIWNTGLFTIKLCAQDTYVDTPWREQTHYIAGDTRMLLNYSFYSFGLSSQLLMQYNILCAAWSQRWFKDGSIRTRYPTDYLLGEGTSECLNDYELEWVIMLSEYYKYFGDTELIKFVYPNMKKVIHSFNQYISKDHGLLSKIKGWVVLDHPDTYPMDQKDEITGMNCLYYAALKSAAFIASTIFNDPTEASKWEKQSVSVKKNIQKWLWSSDKKLYPDSYGSTKFSQQTQVYALLYGLVPDDSRKKEADYIASLNRNSEQSFSYYLLNTMFNQQEQWSLDYIRKYWGAQMKSPLFNGGWHEAWEIDKIKDDAFTTSHAWCSGPTALLPQKVLGIEPLENGWKKFTVNPHLCDLKWAKGIVPSKYGSIEINWNIDVNGKFSLYVNVPESTEANIYIPGKDIYINNKIIDIKNSFDGRSLYIVTEGEYLITSVINK